MQKLNIELELYLIIALDFCFTVLFLAISTCFEFICVILYAFYFPKLPIVKYYRSRAALEGSKTVSSDLAAAGIHNSSENQVSMQLFPKLEISKFFITCFSLLTG